MNKLKHHVRHRPALRRRRVRCGDVEAIARKLRMLAETLSRHARLIQERGHA